MKPDSQDPNTEQLKEANQFLQERLKNLENEYEDLHLLYEGTLEHGTMIENELNDKNQALEETQERLKKELSEAANYIQSLLPALLNDRVKTYWKFIPSSELGGDSFGYHWIDPDHLAIYLLDVCGHGVGAALLSATAISYLKTMSNENVYQDAAAVLNQLNKAFPMEKHNGMYFTIWYGIYQDSTRQLNYASAGHPPSLLLSYNNGQPFLQQLLTKQVMIGFLPDHKYFSQTCLVPEKSSLFVFSDGIFELEKQDGTQFTFEEFLDKFNNIYSHQETELDEVIQQLQKIQNRKEFDDDFSLVKIDL